MKRLFFLFSIFLFANLISQTLTFQTLLKDKISIRAIQIWDGKVWYTGTDAKFGYINLNHPEDKKQLIISDKKLEFRTLAQNETHFYTVNIQSPAYFFKIDKKTLKCYNILTDTLKWIFYDAMQFDSKNRGIAISDPNEHGSGNPMIINPMNSMQNKTVKTNFPKYFTGEAHFAASNTNIALYKNWVWIASGGIKARIFKFNWKNFGNWEAFDTPFIQGKESQGIYSINFFDENFGIAVGGDYTQQNENINNIATTNDGGKTWQIQASGNNAGYTTCVKFRPKSKGKDLIAVGDQHISFSSDYGKTWTKIADEKNLYVCQWIDENTLVFAGKDRIVKATFTSK